METDIDVELSILVYGEESECQSSHRPPIAECSIGVVARKIVTCCGKTLNICQNSYEYNMRMLAGEHPGSRCGKCKKTPAECFKIFPI